MLEAFEATASIRASRITKLGRAIVALAASERIDVAVFNLSEVRETFLHVGARTRQEIAGSVARLLPELARYLPSARRPWQSERWRLSVFSAAALALTHYQRDAWNLLGDLGA